MKRILLSIYGCPLGVIVMAILLLVFLWAASGYVSITVWKKLLRWKWFNIVLSVCGIVVILYTTILKRQVTEREIILIPFYSFYEAIGQPEFYRSMLMNVFLFVPIGLTVPFVLLDKVHKQVSRSVLFGFGLSIGIEVIQFAFCLGRAEVDDVICNTLGTFIGSLSFWVYSRLERSKSV